MCFTHTQTHTNAHLCTKAKSETRKVDKAVTVMVRQFVALYSIRQHTAAYVSIRQHTSAHVSIRQQTSANVSIRQHTSAHVSKRHLS